MDVTTSLNAFETSTWVILAIMVWVLPWKGWALWHAAKLGHKWWFIAILILNTLALLDIAYILFVAKPEMRRRGEMQI